jgi:hypothetical protein
VRVEFQIKDAPPLPVEGGEYLFKFPPSGLLRTSSSEELGWAKDHYFYYSEKGARILPDTPPGGGGLIKPQAGQSIATHSLGTHLSCYDSDHDYAGME